MFERFTDSARQVVIAAQAEARSLKHAYIGTEHILLGLLHEGGVAAAALAALGVDLAATRAQVIEVVGQGSEVPSRQLPFTPMAKKTLEQALREALGLGHSYIGTEHLLLGLSRIPDGVAARILADHEVTTNELVIEVSRLIARRQGRTELWVAGRWVEPESPEAITQDEEIEPWLRSLTVGQLLDTVAAAKTKAIEETDFERAAALRNLERGLQRLLIAVQQAEPPEDTDRQDTGSR